MKNLLQKIANKNIISENTIDDLAIFAPLLLVFALIFTIMFVSEPESAQCNISKSQTAPDKLIMQIQENQKVIDEYNAIFDMLNAYYSDQVANCETVVKFLHKDNEHAAQIEIIKTDMKTAHNKYFKNPLMSL